MKSKEYFNFILSVIENDLKIYKSTENLFRCIYILNVLRSSADLKKDIYIISRIKNLKNFGNYLIFVLKKIESGEVKFENLLENLRLDKGFLLEEFKRCFRLEKTLETNIDIKSQNEQFLMKKTKEKDITIEIKRVLAESKFKVEEIDNELVAEEFIESDVKEETNKIIQGNYLELLPPDNNLDQNYVFTLPTETITNEERGLHRDDGKEFLIPVNENTETEEEQKQISKIEQVNIQELEEIEIEKEKIVFTSEECNGEEKDKPTTDKEIEGTQELIDDNLEKEIAIKLPKEKLENDEKPEEIKSQIVENSIYIKYETELTKNNTLIKNNLESLSKINREDKDQTEEKDIILNEIIEISSYMEEYSRRMSFEVITSIYKIINETFSFYGRKIGIEINKLFEESINLIDRLIKGEDVDGYDDVMKSLDVLKHTLIETGRSEEKEEEKDKKLTQTNKQKQPDDREGQKLTLLKQNIIEVENIFKSIEDIKGRYQAYEALRRLSHTFAHFKDLVNIANSLEMRKLAQLAEASYIFVKFIQNYRMNPFESEITNIFKYIVYNFKLIFLNKPTKDIDLLISYLNDPVKIFEKKDKF